MVDYAKFERLADSGSDEDSPRRRMAESIQQESEEHRKQLKDEVDRWLKRQVTRVHNEAERSNDEPARRRNDDYGHGRNDYGYGRSDFSSGGPMNFGLGRGPSYDSSYPSASYHFDRFDGAKKQNQLPMRKVTSEERKVLAMLVAVSHFEEGETNLDRHPQLLTLVRQNRWLEEDPGTLELLCRIHNTLLKQGTEGGEERVVNEDAELDARMRHMILSAINTLAAPKGAKCEGGLLDMITKICTPETDAARDLRVKWQKKEFGKDAIFDSLFPNMRAEVEEDKGNDWEIWVILGLIVLSLVGFGIMAYLMWTTRKVKSVVNATANATTAVINTTVAATQPAAAAAAVAGEAVAAAAAAGLPPAAGGSESGRAEL